MTTPWQPETLAWNNDSEEDVGLTNNKHVHNRRIRQYEHTKNHSFCYAMVIILILAIGVVSGMFVAMSQDDVLVEQTPIITVKNFFSPDNATTSIIMETTPIPIQFTTSSVETTKRPSAQTTKTPTDSPTTTTAKPSPKPTTTTARPTAALTTRLKHATPTKQPTNVFDHSKLSNMLRTKHNLSFTASSLHLPQNKTSLEDGHILTTIIIDDEYQIPHVYRDAFVWNIQYPLRDEPDDIDMHYQANEHRKYCFHFYLYEYPSAQIDIQFSSFQVERGFDRVLIRHFNQSFIDPPLVITGRGAFDEEEYPHFIPKPLTYHVLRNEFKSICMDLETDDSIQLSGIKFNVSVRYDSCSWTDWSECYIADVIHHNWTTKPFYDGQCGIGIRSRTRIPNNKNTISNGFIDCTESVTYAPEYCIKALCRNINNRDTDPNCFNGFGRIDPANANVLRILPAYTPWDANITIDQVETYMQSAPVSNDVQGFDIGFILKQLHTLKQQIIGEHVNEKLLSNALKLQISESHSIDYLGARLASSLLLGRPFTITVLGNQNTAGYRHQFASTYPIQLQSRLRTLWQRIGMDGAAFNVRNVAMRDDVLGVNVTSLYASLSASDIILWEYDPSDPLLKIAASIMEFQLRQTAMLNAIWAPITMITNNCDELTDQGSMDNTLSSLFEHYGPLMGLLHLDMTHSLDAMCDREEYKQLKTDGVLNVNAHKIMADILSYTLLEHFDAAIQFIEKYKRIIGNSNKQLYNWLVKKSGDWKSNIGSKESLYCDTLCGGMDAPFILHSLEPNDWNGGFRLSDYIYNDYFTSNKQFDFTDLKSLEVLGWSYRDLSDDPSHYPQDKLGDVGSMDRINGFIPNRAFFRQEFDAFILEMDANVAKEMNKSVDKRTYYEKYTEEFMEYMINHNLVLKIGLVIRRNDMGSMIMINGKGRADFIGNDLNIYELLLTPIANENGGNDKKELRMDFNQFLSTQRQCMDTVVGCLISPILPNKYVLMIIPKNILLLTDDVNDITLAITSIITF
eukprot:533504_1